MDACTHAYSARDLHACTQTCIESVLCNESSLASISTCSPQPPPSPFTPQLAGSIRCLAAKADLTFAGVGQDVVECKRVHRCVRACACAVAAAPGGASQGQTQQAAPL